MKQNLRIDISSKILSGRSNNTSIGHTFSIFSKTGNSLFLPFESSHFTDPVILHTSCTPLKLNKMNPIPFLFSIANYLKLYYPTSVN